ncbi:MAG: endonuclease/exonuclease/phosphatase family protein [Ardenticatenales bacterium]|nr:endonuclease/exonuclease/phosphatase family protein [Ardenticatenales bacterium]
MLRLTKGLVTIAVVLYSTPLTAWLLFRAWYGEQWPMVGALNAVGLWWFAPLVVLLPVALLVRARQATLMSLLILLPALLFFGDDFLPGQSREVAEDIPRLRVLSFNALISNVAYDAVAETIRTEEPDVIAIQELSEEMAAELTARVGEQYPYQLLYPSPYPDGIGLWSRYPLREGPSLDYAGWKHWAQSATVEVEGHSVRLFNIHLWPIGVLDRELFARNLAYQHAQVAVLQKVIAETEGAVLVVGDFNASPTNESYHRMDEELVDAWREVAIGPGFTWPAPGARLRWSQPFLRIDYMWTKGRVTPLRVRVLPRIGSDHLPLVGDFALE